MPIQSLTRDELLALLRAAKAKRERDWLMILVAFIHGLRASEVVHLTRDNFQDGFLTVDRKKGSLRTTQPYVQHSEPLLNEREGVARHVCFGPGNQRVFPITRQHFWRLLQRYGESAGLPAHKRHPHVLKHSIAMQMIGTAGIENTRQYLGHKSISSTGEYLKVTDEDASRAARRALDV